MKQAISTGWYCPRAKILVKLRDNMSEDFETQTIGRIRRMPQAHHYENTLLDNCYLYTFDEKYEQSVKQELGKNAKNAKVIFLKQEYKDFVLKKMSIESDFDGFDDRETFNILYKYYVDKYNLTSSKKNNKTILEANGYVFKDTIDNYIVKGKFIRLDEIQDAQRMKVESAVNPSKNGYEYRDSITEIASKIGIRYDRTKLMLERLFLKSKLFSKKFVDLSLLEFYAFIINNHDTIKHDFEEAVNQKARQMKMKLEGIKESNWRMPQEDYINYDPQMKDTTVYEKNTYKEYPSSRVKSRSESMFEFYCETSDNIKWFYKNGESADNYFSIVYVNAVQKKFHFYPDYIICDKNDKIWIIETKGGESATGESKNIDIKVENKFFEHFGFKVVDMIGEYELLSLSFEGTNPKFNDNARKMKIDNKEFTIYYSPECPFIINCLNEVMEYAKENNISLNVIKIDTLEKAKNVPCVFNNWANFYKGKYISNTLLNKNSFERIIK